MKALLKQLITTNTGVSHKRAIALLFSIVVVVVLIVLLLFRVPQGNEDLIKHILTIFSGVIVFESGASVWEKRK